MKRTLRKTNPGGTGRPPLGAPRAMREAAAASGAAAPARRASAGPRGPTLLGDAVVDDPAGHGLPHHALDALQLLLLERRAKAHALRDGTGGRMATPPGAPRRRRFCRSAYAHSGAAAAAVRG